MSYFLIFFSGGSRCYTRNFLPKRENFHVQLQDIVVDQQPVHFADTASFLEKLKKANKSAVIFSVTDPKPQPKLSGPSLLQVLPHLYNTDNVILSPDELNANLPKLTTGLINIQGASSGSAAITFFHAQIS